MSIIIEPLRPRGALNGILPFGSILDFGTLLAHWSSLHCWALSSWDSSFTGHFSVRLLAPGWGFCGRTWAPFWDAMAICYSHGWNNSKPIQFIIHTNCHPKSWMISGTWWTQNSFAFLGSWQNLLEVCRSCGPSPPWTSPSFSMEVSFRQRRHMQLVGPQVDANLG